jgi:tripartite-type tricarboxylate transporter receptor subunit TctC
MRCGCQCLLIVSLLLPAVMAQDTTYPSEPVRPIPPAAPGGNPDNDGPPIGA